jgi:clan AA aspartic protease (TIGR02281 family)
MNEKSPSPLDLGPRINRPDHKDSRWPAIVALFSLLIMGVALFGGYQFWERYQAVSRVEAFIDLHPEGWTNEELIALASQLEKLGHSSCDFKALINIASVIQRKGNGSDLVVFYSKAISRCPHNFDFAYRGWLSAQNAGDFQQSLFLADRLVIEEPASAAVRALRGQSYEAMGEYRLALGDYLSALELLGDKSRVAPSEFLRLARTFGKLEEFCNAVAILELYVSFDVVNRRNPQVQALINEYAAKGHCFSQSAPNTVRGTRVGQLLIVSANINGVAARLMVDTGATFTALTPRLAERAGIKFDGKKIQVHGFSGVSTVQMGRLPIISVGNTTIKDIDVVPLAPAPSNQTAYDGLLGMNFLTLAGFRLVDDRLELGIR